MATKDRESAGGALWRGRRWLLPGIGGVVLVALAGLWGLWGRYYGMVAAEAAEPEIVTTEADVSPSPEPLSEAEQLERELEARLQTGAEALPADGAEVQHILLIGCDGDAIEGVRSDSMMVLSIHREREEIILCSLMRDIWLDIPGYWTERLNAAYAIGGPELLLETVRTNFEIPVENYVAVDYTGFRKLVEALGGVTVELEPGEAEATNRHISDGAALPAEALGPTQLTPSQALAYARQRDMGASDFDRTARQRKLLTALAGELRGIGLLDLHELAMAVLPYVKTDLSQGQIFGILLRGREYLAYEVQSLRLPVEGSYAGEMIDGKSVLTVDLEQNRAAWRTAVYGPAA